MIASMIGPMIGDLQSAPAGGVTKVVDRVPRPGEDEALEKAIRDMIAAATALPGHLGVTVTRPAPPVQPGFRIIYRFDTPEHLQAWLDSEAYARLAAVADSHTLGPAQSRDLVGLEAWFTLPGTPRPPRRDRMTAVTWLGIFPLTAAIGWLLGRLLPPGAPWLLRAALTTALVVPAMTYAVAPWLTRLFRRWLYPEPKA